MKNDLFNKTQDFDGELSRTDNNACLPVGMARLPVGMG